MMNVVAYENTLKRFAAEGIAYEVLETKGYHLTLKLSKDGFSAPISFDFGSEHAEQIADTAIQALQNFVMWDKQEQERQERKRKRAEKKKR